MKKIIRMFSAALILAAGLFAFSVNTQAAVIVLDPGHGGPGTSGAGCIYPPYMEKIQTLDLANQLKNELSNVPGLTVYMTRTSDTYMSLDERAAYAKSVGADFLISLHFNSSGPHDKTGTEVWTSAFGENFTKGYHLGQQVLAQYTAFGLESKGVKTKLGTEGDYYGIIRNGVAMGIPTIIIEHCFLDNPYDRSVYERIGNSGFAHADATAIINYARANLGIEEAIQAKAKAEAEALAKAQAEALAKAQAEAAAKGGAAADPNDPEALKAAAAAQAAQAANTIVSKTKYGFPVDGAGGVHYSDPGGSSTVFSAAEWKKLLSNWSYTTDAEAYLKQISVDELKKLLAK